MKTTRIILVLLIFASLLLAGCTDRKAKSSDSAADLPKPTLTPGTIESLQPDSSAADGTASSDSPEPAQPDSQEAPTSDTNTQPTEPSSAETSEPSDPADPTDASGTAAATTEYISGTDPVETEPADDTGGIPVEEDPTIYVSGEVELIVGD